MRFYLWPPNPPHELEVASVTTIIGEGIPKPALIGWAAKITAECAIDRHDIIDAMIKDGDASGALDYLKRARYRASGDKADIGTITHMAVEAFLRGDELSDSDLQDMLKERRVPMENWKATRGYINGAFRFLKERQPTVQHIEATVFSRTHSYSGTADILALMDLEGDEVPVVCDFKTSKKIYPEVGLQLCAYSRGEFVGDKETGEEMPLFPGSEPCRDGIAVRLTPRGEYEAVRFKLSDELFDVFLAAQGVTLGVKTGVVSGSMGYAM